MEDCARDAASLTINSDQLTEVTNEIEEICEFIKLLYSHKHTHTYIHTHTHTHTHTYIHTYIHTVPLCRVHAQAYERLDALVRQFNLIT